jgi:hypothetical protein
MERGAMGNQGADHKKFIMPVDYSQYPDNWFTEIRPAILERAGHKCEQCKVENYKIILRGSWNGKPAYQDEDGMIYDAETSERIGGDYVGEVDRSGKNRFIKVILTVAHICNDSMCKNLLHLLALCQRCHLRLDIGHHTKNRRANRMKKQGQLDLVNELKSAIMPFQVAPGTYLYGVEDTKRIIVFQGGNRGGKTMHQERILKELEDKGVRVITAKRDIPLKGNSYEFDGDEPIEDRILRLMRENCDKDAITGNGEPRK